MRYITGKYVWLLAISFLLLAISCSSDSTDTGGGEQRTGSPLQVMPYTTAYQSNQALSRAASTGYSEYTPLHDITIGLFVLPDTDNPPTAKLIRYSSGVWHSQAMVEGGHNYTIYGYMPKESITSSISQSGGNVILTLSGINAVNADDVCFVTGVKDETGDLLQGQFSYAGKSSGNNLRLLMDHLFAALNVQFSVDPDYAALRTIKLKSLMVTTTKSSVDATITLTPNTTDTDPVTSVTYSNLTGTSSSATFFESATGEVLTDASISKYYCCFAPELCGSLTLVSTYDVYDRKGNKIREDCTATNKLPNLNAVRGQRVTLSLNVAPTYLGQLSEQDLDDNLKFTVN